MISEEQQDQAALYALGLLDADEAAAFERATAEDGELRVLAGELREAVASLARADTDIAPPPELKSRVLARIAEEGRAKPGTNNVIAGPSSWARWVPWAAAAAFAIGCGVLAWQVSSYKSRYQETRDSLGTERVQRILATPDDGRANAMQQIVYCALDPVPAPSTVPQAAVLWDAAQRRGRLQIHKLPLPDTGKDYQLWTLEAGHKNPVSAGVVKLDADGGAAVDFQPGSGDDAQAAVTAFALSMERAGGVPQNEGPILFVGKLSR